MRRLQVKQVMHAGFYTILLSAVIFFLTGCSNTGSGLDNYPYEPDTPAPAAHEGIFVSGYGTMEFNGDGESVSIDFDKELAELTGLPEGHQEGVYEFLSGNLPPHGSFPVRYDIAHEMRITIGDQSALIDLGIASEDGKTGQVGVNVVTPERIPMLFSEDGFFTVEFRKEEHDPVIPHDDRTVTQFFFQESYGSDYDRAVVCRLEYNAGDGSYTVFFKPDGVKEKDGLTAHTEGDFGSQLKAVLWEHDIESWNGFDGKDTDIMDGIGFSLYVSFSDGSGIKANGYMEWPDHYVAAAEAIHELFRDACEGSAP